MGSAIAPLPVPRSSTRNKLPLPSRQCEQLCCRSRRGCPLRVQGEGGRQAGRGYALQSHLNQQLGIGTRNQRRRRHSEIQPVKFALAEDVGERFAAQTPLEQRRVIRLLSDVEDLFGMGEQVSTVHLQHRLQQALHLDARAAGIQIQRGSQSLAVVAEDVLNG